MKKIAWKPVLILLLTAVVIGWAVMQWTGGWSVPASAMKLANPVPATEATLAQARLDYEDRCARCHGDSGRGDGPKSKNTWSRPTDFTKTAQMNAMTDGEIFWKMSEGHGSMPAFKTRLAEEQRWALVNYLRTFSKTPSASAP